MAKQNDTLNFDTEGLKGIINDLKKEIESYKEELQQLDKITKIYNDTLGVLEEAQKTIKGINEDVHTATESIVAVYKEIIPVVNDAAEQLREYGDINKVVNKLSDALSETFSDIKDNVFDEAIADLRKEVETYTHELTKLVAGSQLYNDTLALLANAETKLNTINKQVEATVSDIVDVYKQLNPAVTKAVEKLNEYKDVSSIVNKVNRVLAHTFDEVKENLFENALDGLKDNLDEYRDKLENVITDSKLYNDALGVLTEAQDKIKSVNQEVQATTESLGKAYDDVKDKVDGAIAKVKEYGNVNNALKGVGDVVSGLFGKITKVNPKDIFSGLKQEMESYTDQMSNFDAGDAQELLIGILEKLSGANKQAKETTDKLEESVAQLNDDYVDFTEVVEENKETTEDLRETLGVLQIQTEACKDEIQDLSLYSVEYNMKLNSLNNIIGELYDSNKDYSGSLEEVDDSYNKLGLEIISIIYKLKDFQTAISTLIYELGIYKFVSQGINQENQNLSTSFNNLEEACQSLNNIFLLLRNSFESSTYPIQVVKDEIEKYNQKGNEAFSSTEKLQSSFQKLPSVLQQLTTTLSSITTLVDKYKNSGNLASVTSSNLSKTLIELRNSINNVTESLQTHKGAIDEIKTAMEEQQQTVNIANETYGNTGTSLEDLQVILEIIAETLSGQKQAIDDISAALELMLESTDEASIANETLSESQVKITDTAPTQTIAGLVGEIGKYQDALLNLDKKSDEYKDTVRDLAEAQDRLKQVMNTTGSASGNFAGGFQHVATVTDQLSKGFDAYIKLAENVGMENDGITNTLNAMKTAMSIVQPINSLIQALNAAKIAMAALNVTMLANPYVALAAGIAILAVGLVALVNSSSDAETGLDKLKRKHQEFTDQLEETDEELEHNIELQRIEGKSEIELLAIRRETTKDSIKEIDKRIASIQDEIKAQRYRSGYSKKIIEQRQKEIDDLIAIREGYEAKTVKINRRAEIEQKRHEQELIKEQERIIKEMEAKKEMEAEQKKMFAKIEHQQQLAEEKAAKQKLQDEEDRAAEERKQKAEDLVNELKNIDKQKEEIEREEKKRKAELLKQQEDANKTQAQLDKERLEALQLEIAGKEDAKNELLAIANDLTKSDEERTKAAQDYQQAVKDGLELQAQEKELQEEINEREKQLREELEAAEARKLEIENEKNLTEAEKLRLQQEKLEADRVELDAKLKNLQEELNAEELTNERKLELLNEYNEAILASSELNQELSDVKLALNDAEKKSLEEKLNFTKEKLAEATAILGEETVAGKAASIAAATISTYQSATSAYSSMAGIPIVGPALGVAAAGAAVASGLANIKEIAKTKVPGASDSASGADVSDNSDAAALPSMPELTSPIQETHNNLDGNDEDFFNQSTKVYVVESDISTVQNRVQVVEGETSF